MENKSIINISKKTFISVVIILSILILLSIGLTYLIPKGTFVDGKYHILTDYKGIEIWKGILSPLLVIGSSDGLTLTMLIIFLMIVTGTFQVLSDTNGIKMIVRKLIKIFAKNKKLLIGVVIFIFMCFGSFFGLYEETLALLPLIISLTISLGYDSYTGFLICTIATGFGFSVAITNPFTILVACELIDANIIQGVGFRLITFAIIYVVLLFFVLNHLEKIEKNPEKSPTYDSDEKQRRNSRQVDDITYDNRIFTSNSIFLIIVLLTIIVFTLIKPIRDYTVVALIVVFLVGGIITGMINTNKNGKLVLNSFKKGIISVVPAILLILMASSIKYILVEGQILDTITNFMITTSINKSPLGAVFIILLVVLLLEFFISSSTAKAIIVMGVLEGVLGTLEISKEMLVLIYTYGDGFTNTLFPTSPVLLIALSVTGMSYFKWLKKSSLLFLVIGILVCLFIIAAYILHY